MEDFLPDQVKVVLGVLILIAFALNRLGRVFPDVRWLRVFRLPQLQLSEAERAERRRSANRLVGLQIIVAGLALPLVYLFAMLFRFDEPTTAAMVVVGVIAVACIAVGIWIFARNL